MKDGIETIKFADAELKFNQAMLDAVVGLHRNDRDNNRNPPTQPPGWPHTHHRMTQDYTQSDFAFEFYKLNRNYFNISTEWERVKGHYQLDALRNALSDGGFSDKAQALLRNLMLRATEKNFESANLTDVKQKIEGHLRVIKYRRGYSEDSSFDVTTERSGMEEMMKETAVPIGNLSIGELLLPKPTPTTGAGGAEPGVPKQLKEKGKT
jgi:hypothetical protein